MGIKVKENDVIVLKVKIAGYPFEIGSKFTVSGIDLENEVITIKSGMCTGFMNFDELDRFFDIEIQKEQWSNWKYTSPNHSVYNIEYRTKGRKTQVKIRKHSKSFIGSAYRLEEDEHDICKGISVAELKALSKLIDYEIELTKGDNKPKQPKTPKIKIETKFKRGDRVICVSKSVFDNLETWLKKPNYIGRHFKEKGYIFVKSFSKKRGCYVCSITEDCDGDFFLESDLIPYIEKPIEQKVEFKVGDKVKILSKSTGMSLEEWAEDGDDFRFLEKNGYLYIVHIEGGKIHCYYDKDCTWGNFFLEKDLELYVESKVDEVEFIVGMKVVPISKSVYSKLENWISRDAYIPKFFRENGYLYLVRIDVNGEVLCNSSLECTGDFFKMSDLKPYTN